MGVVDSQGTSVAKEKKILPSLDHNKSDTSKPAKSSSDKPAKSSSDSRSAKSSADTKIDSLDQKWSERFNQLEALLHDRSLDKPQEPTFQTVKVTRSHTAPVGSVKVTDPSNRPIKPVDRSQSVTQPTDRPTAMDRPQSIDRPTASDLSGTNPPTLQ